MLWRLRLLGGFELSDGAQRHTKLGTRAAMALLARLALQPGRDHPREALVELLWPDVAADAGRQRLRQTLSTLRQVLEPPTRPGWRVLDADRNAVRLVPGTVSCDALAFEQACRRGAHEPARALYGGDLLPGFFDEWISDERLRLEGLFDRLPVAALPATLPQEAPATEPATEPATAPATAPATQPAALPAAPALPRSALPAYLTRMVGADPQAARLRQAVLQHRLVTLLGPGGAGKTRLSVEVAQVLSVAGLAAGPWLSEAGADPAATHDANTAPFDTVAFVPLATCRSRTQLADQLLLTLRIAAGADGPLQSLVRALEGRRALLVLDNFEQLVDDSAELVAELAARLPQLHQLVTSRRALALAGECEFTVATLGTPADDVPLAEALLNPAVALFIDRARAARAEFHLHAGNRADVVALVRLLDGMPLAIELAAARVRSLSPAQMAGMLRAARDVAAGGGEGDGALALLARAPVRGRADTRHHSMQQTIAWSWDLLDDALRTLLAALTAFSGGFTAVAAQVVCADAAGASAGGMAQRLDELLSHSLLRASAAGSNADELRFNLYEPIREFAQRTLDATAAAALRQRHRAWAVAWAQGLPITPPLREVLTEMPNLVAAMSSAVADGAPQQAVELALGLVPTLEEISLPGAALTALQAAVPACADLTLKSRGLTMLGRLLFRAGHGVASLGLVEQGLALLPDGQPALRSRALLMAGHAAINSGQGPARALACIDEAQALSSALGDAPALARIASLRADIVRQHSLAQAEALQRGALATWEAHGDRLGVMRVRYSLAILAYHARQYPAMCREIEPVIDESGHLQAWARLSASLNVRGTALMAMRRWPEAAADLRRAVQIAWQMLAMLEMAHALQTLSYPLLRSGQAEAALQLAGFLQTYWPVHLGVMPPDNRADLQRMQRIGRRVLGAAACHSALAQGQRLTPALAVALALAAPAPAAGAAQTRLLTA